MDVTYSSSVPDIDSVVELDTKNVSILAVFMLAESEISDVVAPMYLVISCS